MCINTVHGDCKSFTFGKPGVSRANWCNIYDVECGYTSDTDWNTFIPNQGSDYGLDYNGGCDEHFSALIDYDHSGSYTLQQCADKCSNTVHGDCKSFTFGRQGVSRQNWCNIYNVVCSWTSDTDWDTFRPVTSNADAICA